MSKKPIVPGINYDFMRDRIKYELNQHTKEDKKILKNKIIEISGIKRNTISNILGKAKQNMSLEFVAIAAQVLKKPLEYFLYGREISKDKDIGANYIEIPRIKDYLNEDYEFIYERNNKACFYNYNWLKVISENPKAIVCLIFFGDSMEPMIMNGDSIQIDTNRKTLSDGKLFAYHFKNSHHIMIRKFSFQMNQINIIPENQSYQSFSLNPEDINIIGQIILLKRLYIMVNTNF